MLNGAGAVSKTRPNFFLLANRRVLWASTVKDRLLNADDNSKVSCEFTDASGESVALRV